jgi:hypothetical protein
MNRIATGWSTDPVLSRNSNEANSCGFSKVVAEETAESLPALDAPVLWKFCEFRLNDFVLQTLVVALGVIMQSELRNSATQRGLSEEDHSLYAGFFDASDESFRESVQIGTSRRKSQRLDSGTLEDLSELFGKKCGAVMDQEADAVQEAVKGVCQISRYL